MAAEGTHRDRATLHRSTIISENEISYISLDPLGPCYGGCNPLPDATPSVLRAGVVVSGKLSCN